MDFQTLHEFDHAVLDFISKLDLEDPLRAQGLQFAIAIEDRIQERHMG